MSLVYNVLKTMMHINSKLFDDLTNSYKAEKQRYSDISSLIYSLCLATRLNGHSVGA